MDHRFVVLGAVLPVVEGLVGGPWILHTPILGVALLAAVMLGARGRRLTQRRWLGVPIGMRTVAAVPDRLGAGATFHGGGLATEANDSPHLLIPNTSAHMLHCVAANDDESDPDAKVTLRDAYADAGIPAEIEVYEGAMHGWCSLDSQVYHEVQAERAWSRLLVLLETALV